MNALVTVCAHFRFGRRSERLSRRLVFFNLFILCTNNCTSIRINLNDPPLKSSSFYRHPPFFRILKSYDPPHVSTTPPPLLISDKSLNRILYYDHRVLQTTTVVLCAMTAVCPQCVPKLARNMSIYFGTLRFPTLLEALNICRTCYKFSDSKRSVADKTSPRIFINPRFVIR